MNTPLTELQQFLGGHFHQDWTEEHSSADEVIDSFLLESTRETILIVREEIVELISSHTNELDLQHNLLHEQHCYYYYSNQWSSGRSWLNHIVMKFDKCLLENTPL